MRPHAHVSLTADERITLAIWSRRILAICVAAIAVALAPNEGRGQTAQWQQTKESSLRPLCAVWDQQASEAIARRVQDSKGDADLRQLGDSIFRMRRARRTCEQGWVRIACQDYHAIMHNVGGVSAEWPGSASVCPLGMSDGTTANIPQVSKPNQ